jgi:hypothetical protein
MGTVLSETKQVEQEGSAKIRMEVVWVETVHRNGGKTCRKTGHRNSDTELKTENSFWTELWNTMTTPILLRFG